MKGDDDDGGGGQVEGKAEKIFEVGSKGNGCLRRSGFSLNPKNSESVVTTVGIQ
jgi:hypothetical protein